MTTYAFIPARSGSERIRGKNLQEVGGVPLVRKAVLDAQAAECAPVVSTDSLNIFKHAVDWNPNAAHRHRRTPNHAGPNAQIEDAILAWGRRANLADDDVICLLQPTTPFRRPETIRACVEAVKSGKAPCAVTVVRDERALFRGSLWGGPGETLVDWGTLSPDLDIVDHRPRSQDIDSDDAVEEVGSCWAFTWAHIRDTGCRTAHGAHAVIVDWLERFEIDEPWELEVARALAPHVDKIREAMCTP